MTDKICYDNFDIIALCNFFNYVSDAATLSRRTDAFNYFTANKTMQLRIMATPVNINNSFQFYLRYIE